MIETKLLISIAHCCSFPGCQSVLVVDGNMKNRRNICVATEAGFLEYEGLPGSITTGCQLSPLVDSQYCYYHSPRFTSIGEGTASASPVMSSTNKLETDIITGKRETRKGTYYQVKLTFTIGGKQC